MALDLMNQGGDAGGLGKILNRKTGLHPATQEGAAVGFSDNFIPRRSYERLVQEVKEDGDDKDAVREKVQAAALIKRQENRDRQLNLLVSWFKAQIAAKNKPAGKTPEDLQKFIFEWVDAYFQRHPPADIDESGDEKNR